MLIDEYVGSGVDRSVWDGVALEPLDEVLIWQAVCPRVDVLVDIASYDQKARPFKWTYAADPLVA